MKFFPIRSIKKKLLGGEWVRNFQRVTSEIDKGKIDNAVDKYSLELFPFLCEDGNRSFDIDYNKLAEISKSCNKKHDNLVNVEYNRVTSRFISQKYFNKNILIVGNTHLQFHDGYQIMEVIDQFKPDDIALELCKSRVDHIEKYQSDLTDSKQMKILDKIRHRRPFYWLKGTDAIVSFLYQKEFANSPKNSDNKTLEQSFIDIEYQRMLSQFEINQHKCTCSTFDKIQLQIRITALVIKLQILEKIFLQNPYNFLTQKNYELMTSQGTIDKNTQCIHKKIDIQREQEMVSKQLYESKGGNLVMGIGLLHLDRIVMFLQQADEYATNFCEENCGHAKQEDVEAYLLDYADKNFVYCDMLYHNLNHNKNQNNTKD